MTEELTTFMLTSITGIAKEKRKTGTDTETAIERNKCLLNTTGIEPLGGELAEILSPVVHRALRHGRAAERLLPRSDRPGRHRGAPRTDRFRSDPAYQPSVGPAARRRAGEGHAAATPHPGQSRQAPLQRLSEPDVPDAIGRGSAQRNQRSHRGRSTRSSWTGLPR